MSPACAHCGLDLAAAPAGAPGPPSFCCAGCEAAYRMVQELGLGRYYDLRTVGDGAAIRPEADAADTDFAAYARAAGEDEWRLSLAVGGLQCGACVWLIERVLARDPRVTWARVNLSTQRLALTWRGPRAAAGDLLAPVARLGYRLSPFDAARLGDEGRAHERELLRAMAVAGFAAGNVMLLSVSVWAGLGRVLIKWLRR